MLFGHRDVGVAEQGHLRAAGLGGIGQRVQIVFYAVHMAVRIEDDDLIEGGQAVQRLQRTKIAVSGHGVDLHLRVERQRFFQVAQAVAQKDDGGRIALRVKDALDCAGAVVAVTQDQKFRHGTKSSSKFILPFRRPATPASVCRLRSWSRGCPARRPWRQPWGRSPPRSAPVPAVRPVPASGSLRPRQRALRP